MLEKAVDLFKEILGFTFFHNCFAKLWDNGVSVAIDSSVNGEKCCGKTVAEK